MNTPDPDNQLLLDFLATTNQPVFLTGKAGTGKTTLLRKIRDTTKKNFAIVAPTAVAAINAGGVTLHSFFQIPFGPLVPVVDENAETNFKYSDEKTRLLRCLDLLIIDEISMVRVDLIDFIDRTLKRVKGSNRPFGGVQVLMIGDLYQLSPIFHDAWHILGSYYSSPYFFDSLVFRSTPMLTFTLDKVYRQSDPIFLDILNGMRENSLDAGLLAKLNERYDPSLDQEWKDDYITLTTHNQLVNEINQGCLEKLPGEIFEFNAELSGDFPKDAYPTDEKLQLKLGAQVIFIKNDSSGKRQYYNGKAAKITAISQDSIKVTFSSGGREIEVEKEIWQNVKYNLSAEENKIDETSTGSFSQYPFKLAWAITVHKSQGLTFDQAIVDVSTAFTHGQAYVALSRCRSLEGLILKSPVVAENIITDAKVIGFTKATYQDKPSAELLTRYTQQYAWGLIHELLDFSLVAKDWEKLGRSKLIDKDEKNAFLSIYEQGNQILQHEIFKVARNFIAKEFSKISTDENPANESAFRERLQKASDYFVPKLEQLLTLMARIVAINFYNDTHSDKLLTVLNDCKDALQIKLALFKISWNPFSIKDYINTLHAASNKQPEKKQVKSSIKPKEISNPQVYKNLVEWRKTIALQRGTQDYAVLSDLALLSIAEKMPRTTDQLAALKSIGIGNAKELGQQITRIVNAHLGTSELF
ncbi:ATP-dependent DNA helicase UvrD2 [Pedobacter psychrodurus]|uniref:ATP-dependent DNA helicase UvrD2 n=1 Tax=Pedobacter psychrodurus TaxID=2530456 RepID=A0A4R0Q018_9SPHI|nr:HRDC domain-containing protein [Pedobacter psychrodurus]TCD26466.1 ATP-dependent DNA helicase UvrD2 [Pedobacter psychrodurus]